MAKINLLDVSAAVRAIFTDAQATVAATGDAPLDKALAALAQRRRSGRPLTGLESVMYMWSAPPGIVPAR